MAEDTPILAWPIPPAQFAFFGIDSAPRKSCKRIVISAATDIQ
jgi:hypothetical protein